MTTDHTGIFKEELSSTPFVHSLKTMLVQLTSHLSQQSCHINTSKLTSTRTSIRCHLEAQRRRDPPKPQTRHPTHPTLPSTHMPLPVARHPYLPAA